MSPRLLLATAIFTSMALAQAPSVIDFRGVPLGSSEAEFSKAVPELKCYDGKAPTEGDRFCGDYPARNNPFKFAGADAKYVQASFFSDRFGQFTVMLASRDFASVMTALSEKFGKPTLVETPQIQTRAGATFENTTFVWRIGDGEIKGEKFGGSLDSSWVHYTTDFAKSAIGESTKAKAKAAAKSL